MQNFENQIYSFTVDIDWAPDFAITQLAEKLKINQIKCTWFITHDSPAVRELFKEKSLFEFGIHPNFLQNSSQGESPDEIIRNLLAIVSSTNIVRTHSLVQSTALLKDFYRKYNLTTDVSLFLYSANDLRPHRLYLDNSGKYITRLPFFWEDDIATYIPEQEWKLDDFVAGVGLKIFNFHPMYVYLNIKDMVGYEILKTFGPLNSLEEEKAANFVNKSKGAGYFMNILIEYLKIHKLSTFKISEITGMFEGGLL